MAWKDRIILAWVRRSDRNGDKHHPYKAHRIYSRHSGIIDSALLAGKQGRA